MRVSGKCREKGDKCTPDMAKLCGSNTSVWLKGTVLPVLIFYNLGSMGQSTTASRPSWTSWGPNPSVMSTDQNKVNSCKDNQHGTAEGWGLLCEWLPSAFNSETASCNRTGQRINWAWSFFRNAVMMGRSGDTVLPQICLSQAKHQPVLDCQCSATDTGV